MHRCAFALHARLWRVLWPLCAQDAADTIEKVLRTEQDLSTKRNAFIMLSQHAQDRAARYLFENVEAAANWGDILQMAVLELIRKVRAGCTRTEH